jgi:hypothetical protein
LEALRLQQVEGGAGGEKEGGVSAEEMIAIKSQMDENMRLLDSINMSWEERLKHTVRWSVSVVGFCDRVSLKDAIGPRNCQG